MHRRRAPLWRPFGCEYAGDLRWNGLERFYIRLFGQVDLPTRMRARLIEKALRKVPWKTMLDFGCGTGVYSFYFSRSPRVRVWGVDIQKHRIADLTALNKKLKRKSLDFVCGSSIFETGRFQPDSIDVVLAVEVLQYLPDVRAGFQEIQRVLKAGGYLISHFPMLGYRRIPETALLETEQIACFIKETGLEPVSITRRFGKAANLLFLIYSLCCCCRLFTALAFPLLLLASLPFGGEDPCGSYCLAIARKPGRENPGADSLTISAA